MNEIDREDDRDDITQGTDGEKRNGEVCKVRWDIQNNE